MPKAQQRDNEERFFNVADDERDQQQVHQFLFYHTTRYHHIQPCPTNVGIFLRKQNILKKEYFVQIGILRYVGSVCIKASLAIQFVIF